MEYTCSCNGAARMKLFGFSRIGSGKLQFGLHVKVKSCNLDEHLIFRWEDSWACTREYASNLLSWNQLFGLLYSDLVGPSWRHWNLCSSQLLSHCWLMFGSSWGHLKLCSIQLLSCRHVRWSAHMVCFTSVKFWEGWDSVWFAKLESWYHYNWYWSLERATWGGDKLNVDWFRINYLDPLWLFEINCNVAFGIR